MTKKKGPEAFDKYGSDAFDKFSKMLVQEILRDASEDEVHHFVQELGEAAMRETAHDTYKLLDGIKHKNVTPSMLVTEFHAALAYHSMQQWATILGAATGATEAEFHKNMDNILIAMKREGLRTFKEEKLNRVMRDKERERS